MKIGVFDHEELLIDTKNNALIHKTSGCWVKYEKSDNEGENLKRFQNALRNLETRYGLYLIDKL